jgi:ABC-type uncharacterized transport system involved in gliding motility auxiliary subunit
MRGRTRRRTLLAAGVIAVLVLGANLAVYGRTAEIDLSANRRFSLSPESRDLAGAVRSHMEITAFLSGVSSQARDARFLLARYHEVNRHITYRVVDPDADPAEARRFGITAYSTVVLTYQGRRLDAPDAEELELSTAMLQLLRGGTKTVCVVTGHGEPDLADTSPTGLSAFAKLLQDNAYIARPLNLTTGNGQVPPDCAAVFVIGPVDPLGTTEVSALVAWTKGAGRLMVLASPLTRSDVNPLLAPWGVHFAGGLVLDPARSQGLDYSNVIVQSFPSASPVVRAVTEVQYPAGGGLVVDAGTRGGLTVERLAATSSKSWIETNPDVETQLDARDIPGPVTVAAAADDSRVEQGPVGGRIVRTRVFATGGAGWAANAFLNNLSNRRLMTNALSWLTQQEALVAATSRPNSVRPLPLTAERRTRILVTTVGVVPGAIIGVGLTAGYVRRRTRRRRGAAARARRRSARP